MPPPSPAVPPPSPCALDESMSPESDAASTEPAAAAPPPPEDLEFDPDDIVPGKIGAGTGRLVGKCWEVSWDKPE